MPTRRALIALTLLATPALAQSEQTKKRAQINQLLDALKAAPSETAAAALEATLTERMTNAGSPAVTLLMTRGLRELHAGNTKDAIEDFSDAITLDPTLAEAYRQLALARYVAGDARGAIEDLALAVQHQPRNVLAYKTLTDIAEQRQDWKGAYEAWQKVLALDPQTPHGQDRLNRLRTKALGQET